MNISCAVIGNSPILLGSHYGEEIDSCDEVIRCNDAPIRGLEKDVGSKTTIRVINGWTARFIINPENVIANPEYKHLSDNFSNWQNTNVSDLLDCNALFVKDGWGPPTTERVYEAVGDTHDVFGLNKSGFDRMAKLSNSIICKF